MASLRRLAAILAADIVGYSRLIGLDEAGTVQALREHRAAADPLVAEHGGRVFKTTGDGLLIEFASVVGAVECALALQHLAAERNAEVPGDRRMEWRIGVHLGDVLIEGEDILGEGVNIAARLESIAEPGGICISEDAFRQVRGKVEAEFADMGEQSLKNIARSLRVYRLRPNRVAGTANGASKPLPAPLDKPSVAVLPFANMSADPEQEFFADGIAEDVITALSRYPSLFVTARNSSFTYKGRAVDVKQVARELGVRYVLEGSLRKSGNRIRVSAQLVEADTGNHIWAERYDRDLADIFAVQDEITEAVTTAIAPAIGDAERQRAMRKPPGNLDAWGAYQRGLWHLAKGNPADNAVAEKFFQQAIDLDPVFAGGYTGLAAALMRAGGFQTRDPTEAQRVEEELAQRAVALDGGDAEARARLALALSERGDHQGARAEAERALAITPNLASAHGALGIALMYTGKPKEGLAALETDIRLDPRGPLMMNRLSQVAIALYFLREYAAVVEAAKRAIRTFPHRWSYYRTLAAALGQLGQTVEAREALEKAISLAPAQFDSYVRSPPRWIRSEDYDHELEGLRKAGWTE
jgi:adenylate cyclase